MNTPSKLEMLKMNLRLHRTSCIDSSDRVSLEMRQESIKFLKKEIERLEVWTEHLTVRTQTNIYVIRSIQ